MDNFNFKNMVLAYNAVHDNVLRESMEELGFFGETSTEQDAFENWVNGLLDEGYDLSDYTWDELGTLYEKTGTPKSPFSFRTGLTPKERSTRRSRDFFSYGKDPDPEERPISTSKGPGGITKNPKKLRKQKALGEFGEQVDIYDNLNEASRKPTSPNTNYRRFPWRRVGEKIDKMQKNPNIDTVFGNDARRRNEMMRVFAHMKGEAHPLIRALSPKQSQANEEENRARGKAKRSQDNNGQIKEQYDIYDLVLEHLIDEGYAESLDNAEAIMANMSEGWIDSIMEAEGSFGMTPLSHRRYSDRARQLSNSKKNRGKYDDLSRRARNTDPRPNPPGYRRGMTPDDRTYLRGYDESEDHDEPRGPGSLPKGKKLKRQRMSGVSR